ncbi:MAG: TlpA family protein disulfide reductase [Proteobacteria bacterium]|nr:TlpA family protein disulfide reductase [Pseudomonadota bacterium]
MEPLGFERAGRISVTPDKSPASSSVGRTAVLATVIAAGLAGFGAVYVMAGGTDNGLQSKPVQVAEAPAALPSGPGTNPLSVGTMAAFVFKKAPEAIPEFPFLDKDGKQRLLKEWQGKVVLLNLWATWCAPCRKEMPSLDRLEGELGSDKFQVVAISADKSGIEGAKKFLDQIKVEKLQAFSDPTVRIHSGLKAVGMPATVLLDKQGREIGRLVGPAEWDSAEAKTLIKAVIAQ